MFEIVEEINGYLREIQNFGLDNQSVLSSPAMYVAGIGALILVGIIASNMFMGKRIDHQKLGKILIILIILTMYGPLLNVVNQFLDGVNNTCKTAFASKTDPNKILQEIWDKKKKVQEDKGKSGSNNLLKETSTEVEKEKKETKWYYFGLDGIGEDIKAAFNEAKDNLKLVIITIIEEGLITLTAAIIVILNIIRTTFLIILSILGVFAIGLSMIPGLENSGYSWLQKYVNTYLWLSVSYIIQGIVGNLLESYSSNINTGTANPTFDLLLVSVCLSTVVLMFLVPTITGYIISASVSSASKFKGYAGKSAGAVASTAKNIIAKK